MATKTQLKQLLWANIILFVIVLIAHLLRILYQARLLVNEIEIPVWLSVGAIIVLGVLVYYNYQHVRK